MMEESKSFKFPLAFIPIYQRVIGNFLNIKIKKCDINHLKKFLTVI